MKLNSVASSRGDYIFTTFTFGLNVSQFGQMITEAILKVRKEGQGKDGFKKVVTFPKLVFLYTDELHGEGKPYEHLFDKAIECSAKAMYPDYTSLNGENNYLATMYHKYGGVVSPMGKPYEHLFDKAIECSAKAMYPDYTSLNGENNYLATMYHKYGGVVSPMGE